MFSGIIEAVGILESQVKSGGGVRMSVDVGRLPMPPVPGDSLAVDGACLTVERLRGRRAEFMLSRETIARTRFGKLRHGARVNLERPVRADQMLGGHIVTGHVDGLARARRVRKQGDAAEIELEVDRSFEPMLVGKGSVAINGVSLTVASLNESAFTVALIPYTLEHTNLSALVPGDLCHFEADIIGKYVVKYLSTLEVGRVKLRERKSAN